MKPRSLYTTSPMPCPHVHLTLPDGFDRSAEIPPVLGLHRGILIDEEIGAMEGIRLTRQVRTIIDLISGRNLVAGFDRAGNRSGCGTPPIHTGTASFGEDEPVRFTIATRVCSGGSMKEVETYAAARTFCQTLEGRLQERAKRGGLVLE